MPIETVWLVSPVYFDVESYLLLRRDAQAALAEGPCGDVRFVAIDDSAGADVDIRRLQSLPGQFVITPPFPLGHQRAVVFGLRRLSAVVRDTDLIVTLDADGEDQPGDLPRLIDPLLDANATIRMVVVAARTRRRESPSFKMLYAVFKIFFRLMTGTIIRSGNYAACRGWLTRNVLFHPNFDLSFSSSLLSLGLYVERVPCERGVRYAGSSKMTYLKLIQHGLRMLMPFADRIATRGIIVFSALLGLGLLAALGLAGLGLAGFFTSPTWVVYLLCTEALLSAVAVTCMVVVFALFAQSQSLSLARLDAGLRALEGDRAPEPSHRPV